MDIGPGDWVECVFERPCKSHCGCESGLMVGALYRIESLFLPKKGQQGCTLLHKPTPGKHTGYKLAWFKPVRDNPLFILRKTDLKVLI